MSGRDVWAISSDHHTNSTLGLCPPEVALDDGGMYTPSAAQSKLWDCWLEYMAAVREAIKPGDRLHILLNGDLVDGDHHNTSQIISRNQSTQIRIAEDVLAPLLALRPKSVFIVRGTEAHVGGSAAFEEILADRIGAVRDPSTGACSWWHFQAETNGVLLDFAHHGRLGGRPWTKVSGPATLAAQIVMASAKHGTPIPTLAVRSHYHQWADSFDNFACRVIQLAGWQLSTAFVHRIAAGALPEIGGIIVACEEGKAEVQKVRFDWKRREPWKLTA